MRNRGSGILELIVAATLTLIAGGCGGGSSAKTSTNTVSSATQAPSSAATVAATSAPVAAPAENGYVANQALPQLNFSQMLGLVTIPGDEDHGLLLTKDGTIRRISFVDDNEAPATFMDITDRIIKNPGQEEGLLGIAFAPDYTVSHRFYLYYSAGNPRRAIISRFIASGNTGDPSSEKQMLSIDEPYANHNGGALAFGPDGDLYIGVGDGGSERDPNNYGQNKDVLLAKILRLDVSGEDAAVPADNPFASGGGQAETYAYGLRNPWRITFDAKTGELWAGDVGQDQWEEVDRIEKGGNYGWSIMEGTHCYKPSSGCDMSGLTLPRGEYSHDLGCSVTGGYVYRGKAMPELAGWYVYGDYCSGRVWAVNTEGDAPPVLLVDTNLSITSFGQGKDGELYIVGFNKQVARLGRKAS